MLVDGLLLFFPEAILRVLLGLPVLSYEDQWTRACCSPRARPF